MTKPKAKAQESAVKESQVAAPEEVVTGDGSGVALPEITESTVEQVADAATPNPEPEPEPEPEGITDVFVLCDGSLDGDTRYKAGCVLQGVPESVVKANTHWLDAAPAAVEAAKANGAQVLTYEG